jgi:hypothetical protein
MSKPWKLKGLEEVLATLPEDQREEAREAITAAFKDFDPDNLGPQFRKLEVIDRGVSNCPDCGDRLVQVGKAFERPLSGGEDMLIETLDCNKCGAIYERPACDA